MIQVIRYRVIQNPHGTSAPVKTLSGQLGAGTRRVTITGTGVYSPNSLSTFSGSKQYVRGLFEAQGWRIINFDISDSGWIFNSPVGINITAEVPDEYTNQAHLDQVYALFNSYYVSNLTSTLHPFSGLNLKIDGQDRSGYTPPNPTTTITGTPTPKPRTNTTSGGGNNNSSGLTADDVTAQISAALSAGTNLFGVAGLTTGVLTLGLIAFVLIRNR